MSPRRSVWLYLLISVAVLVLVVVAAVAFVRGRGRGLSYPPAEATDAGRPRRAGPTRPLRCWRPSARHRPPVG